MPSRETIWRRDLTHIQHRSKKLEFIGCQCDVPFEKQTLPESHDIICICYNFIKNIQSYILFRIGVILKYTYCA